ncbi:MAG: transglutaminase domain-containing protein [Lentisphaerae bacterium]|nr:transglutaminase domain-containing protein [Lentisphaerota bacterium]
MRYSPHSSTPNRSLITITILLSSIATISYSNAIRYHRVFDSQTFNTCTYDNTIAIDSTNGAVRLNSAEHIIHAPGDKLFGTTATTGFGKKLTFSKDLIGKKTFILDNPLAHSATLAIFGPAGQATFNNTPLTFTNHPCQAGWSFATIPSNTLQRGANTLLLHKGFSVIQDRTTDPPQFSHCSRDNGTTWIPLAGGEMVINLQLHRHPAGGTITSPVIDLANPDNRQTITPRLLQPQGGIALTCIADLPTTTSIKLQTRCGSTPWPDNTWSQWQTDPTTGKGRYLQWRAHLTTSNPLATPAITNITLSVTHYKAIYAHSQGITLLNKDDHPITTPSYPYDYQRPSAKLTALATKYHLNDVIAQGTNDFHRLLLLRNWARRQWPGNDGFGGRWDAHEILEAPAGNKGMCVQFANLFSQCALALGYVARPVIINHHFIAEVWLDDLRKWVAFDVEGAYPPLMFKQYATAHYLDTTTRLPLSAREVSGAYWYAINNQLPLISSVTQVFTHDTPTARAVPHHLIRPTAELAPYALIALPLRNNHLDVPEPWEEYHGQDYYHSNTYLWWRNPYSPATPPQYSLISSRPTDFEWSVNQVEISLTATENPHHLSIIAKTMTPNFATFEYNFDHTTWHELGGQSHHPDLQWAQLTWPLKKGTNTIAIRTVNRLGKKGLPSTTTIKLQ